MILELCVVASLLNNYKTCNDVPWCHFETVDIKETMGTRTVKCVDNSFERHFCRLQLKNGRFVYSIETCKEVKEKMNER